MSNPSPQRLRHNSHAISVGPAGSAGRCLSSIAPPFHAGEAENFSDLSSLPPALRISARLLRRYKILIDGVKARPHHENHPTNSQPSVGFLRPKTKSRKTGNGAKTKRRGENSKSESRRAVGAPPPAVAPHNGESAEELSNQRASDEVRAILHTDFDPRIILRPVRDPDGRIRDFVFADTNKAACSYNGLTRKELLGRRLLDLFPNSNHTGLFAMYCRAIETRQPLELRDFPYPHDLHGRTCLLNIRALPVGDDLHYTWRDVTGQTLETDRASAPHPTVLDRRRKKDFAAEAQSQIREFQALAQQLLEQREQEQQNLSRELHDNIAQILSAATTRISLAKDEPIPAWLRQELVDLRDQLKAALEDVRHLARDLRPSLLDHCGFAAALEKHAEAFRERTCMTLDLAVAPDAVSFLDHGDLTHLFRITQEALQNIEEHSGAKNAWINLHARDGTMLLEIGDDGCAFTPERVVEAQKDGHLGLLGMRERAELLGGEFVLEAIPGQGTVINITIPPPRKTRPARATE